MKRVFLSRRDVRYLLMQKNTIYTLKNLGLPAITNLDDLSFLTRISRERLVLLSTQHKRFYNTFLMPKKSGGHRQISQPSRDLKALQSWILRNILDKLSVSKFSKGFEKGSSTLDNATPHIGANYILSLDLEDFFPSIKSGYVFSIFRSIGYNVHVSHTLTNLCVYNGGLPQGAPTSPKLANLICARLDARISGYAGKKGITYTRYADDITFSAQTAKKITKVYSMAKFIIHDEKFVINKDKTYFSGTKRNKKITGLVVTERSVGIGRVMLRSIKAKIHHLLVGKNDDLSHIIGLLSYIYGVDKKNYKHLIRYIQKLSLKYPSVPQELKDMVAKHNNMAVSTLSEV
ncbi:retron St85 family RNA-directed DNA polymerase [Aeromonas salmonicida]|uniref:retron St85 family RNA-directed DNA polymerase n=1 Tax=Aeromonas salmonicida TaxID=645 RepID=UPI00259DEABA|nr:retron St85 family RNA-directed DNA polymerase [Aeromonas salmonicida]MDM5068495.1 retron St85 family RNA-directed DNA polymerase [Aeromonas salmonicida]